MSVADHLWYALLALFGEPVTEPEKLIIRVCSRDDPVGGCDERLAAQARGEFYPDESAWGWVWTEAPLRYMSDNAFNEVYIHRRDYEYKNFTRTPYTYPCCIYCMQELPSLGLLRKFREKQALGQKP